MINFVIKVHLLSFSSLKRNNDILHLWLLKKDPSTEVAEKREIYVKTIKT